MSTTSQPADQNQTPTSVPPAAVPRDFSNLVVSPAIQRSLDAFRAALPELLKNKTASQVWVAFCGDELITFGRTKTEAYRECLQRGLQRGTFVVRMVEPQVSDEVEIPWDA